MPGVARAAASLGLPLEGPGFGTAFSVVGQPGYSDPAQRPGTGFTMVTPEYFQTYGVRIVKGRPFDEHDDASSVKVAVVSEEFVRKFLKGLDPLQQRVAVDEFVPGVTKRGPPIEWQIVGVYHDLRYRGFRQLYPGMAVPFSQSPWPGGGIGVRTVQDPATLINAVTAAVHAVDPDIAVATPRAMEQVRDEMLASDRFTMILFASFAAVALLLGSVGIYGVIAFSVAQRVQELAIRSALGATRRRVVALVVREGLTLACAGLLVGFAGAYLVGRLMRSVLFGIGAIDPFVLSVVTIVLIAAALVACFLPAYRAALVEPLGALRAE